METGKSKGGVADHLSLFRLAFDPEVSLGFARNERFLLVLRSDLHFSAHKNCQIRNLKQRHVICFQLLPSFISHILE